MGCTSAKQLSAVPGDEEGRGKAYGNGEALSDEYKTKGVEKVKYMHGEDGRTNTRNQENLVTHTPACRSVHGTFFTFVRIPSFCAELWLSIGEFQEKNTLFHKGRHKDASGNTNKISIHSSESQQEFFRMLDEKIEKGRDYCSEEEDVT